MRELWRLERVENVVRKAVRELTYNPPLKELPLGEGLGKICGENYFSRIDLPPNPKATMDGYAVRSLDCTGATHVNPITLRLLEGVVRPGEKPSVTLDPNTCIAIETGGFLPENADAVVKVEDTTLLNGGFVEIHKPVARYENISLPGEELKKGDPILRKGDIIHPWHLAALEASGFDEVKVLDLSALVICTGDEFLNSSTFPPFTRQIVRGWLAEKGFLRIELTLVPDDLERIRDEVRRGVNDHTLVIVCGGSSRGSRDLVPKAVDSLSPSLRIRGVAIQPGKTTTLCVIGGKPVLSISGLPVAALSSMELLLAPLIEKWLHVKYPPKPRVKAILTRRLTVKRGVKGFARVKVYRKNGETYAEPLMVGGSGAIRSLILGNGIVVIPEDLEGYDEGDEVEVELYGPIQENLS